MILADNPIAPSTSTSTQFNFVVPFAVNTVPIVCTTYVGGSNTSTYYGFLVGGADYTNNTRFKTKTYAGFPFNYIAIGRWK